MAPVVHRAGHRGLGVHVVSGAVGRLLDVAGRVLELERGGDCYVAARIRRADDSTACRLEGAIRTRMVKAERSMVEPAARAAAVATRVEQEITGEVWPDAATH